MITSILVILIVATAGSTFAEKEYDLSDHPVYNWVYSEDANISTERYSKPAISNQYHFEALNIKKFDPTHHYYEFGISTFDYCDLKQFLKYPKCK
jgi:hypothetical protein|tara:strand:+ start:74 stop:358 length:285 start_codon:yes stop_codon:yes gene_type:complete